MDDVVRRLIADRRASVERYEAEERAAFFASDPSGNVPDLEFSHPPCPICTGSLDLDSDTFWCDACCTGWDLSGRGGTVDLDLVDERPDHPLFPKEDTPDER